MKKITFLMLSFWAVLSFAGEPCKDCGTPNGPKAAPGQNVAVGVQSNTGSQASNDGNSQSVNFNNPGTQSYNGGYKVNTVPAIAAPSLTTTLSETCMGSTSAGVAVMGLGVSGGTTWTDRECVRRLNARELAQTLHEADAAKELLCGNQEINSVYEALARANGQPNRRCLMGPSHLVLMPGGDQANFRDPSAVKPFAPVATPVAAPAPKPEEAPVVMQKIPDEQDMDSQNSQNALKRAEEARAAMKAAHGF